MSQLPPDFLLVGIGASAGGVEALLEFFAHLPADSGCAYVVILHRSPEHESQLDTVLQTVAPVPVTLVSERVCVVPNHVYVVPPNQHLTTVDGELRVSPTVEPEERRAPIDIFFRSLAESHQRRGVCVILSGSGADGSMGLKRVKERGGAVFVQNPREAACGEMPRAAIATDFVDEVLSAGEIPARIAAYRASRGAVAIAEEPEQRPQEQQQALRELFALLRTHTGHDFANYKRSTLLRRIERRISVCKLPDLPAYAAFLREHPDEVQALRKDLLISVTNFFRDTEAFAALEQEVIPRLFAGKSADDQVRVWVVGCATGEEAYSLAMLCAERVMNVPEAPSVQVFASDIDETAIARARQGLYSLVDTADVSPERLRRFFTMEDERYRVRPELRELVLFATHNILADPPFSQIDLITCRNLLIYLNRTAQELVIETFHFALKPDGYLFLGSVESTDSASDLFEPLSREHRLFRRRPSAPSTLPVPVSGLPLPPAALRSPTPPSRPPEADTQVRERAGYGVLHLQLLEQYAPPSLLVDQDFSVLHVSERAGCYLQIGAGEPTTNLLELIRPELRVELRGALYQALQRQANVDTAALLVRVEQRSELVTIRVRPALQPEDPRRGLLLVLFEQGGRAVSEVVTTVRSDEPAMEQLEEDLARLKRQLRTSSEQYEYQAEELKATNEELQALVEELRASGEELETSKEELQSLNEELRTVNGELRIKVEEAMETSADLQNLINSTDIATIFLDRQLRIKRFTPATRKLFNLIPADHGRPLSDITHQLREVDVLAEAERVLATLQTVECEVHAIDGRVFVLRVLPYRAAEDRIGGVVLIFFDITARTRAEEVLRASEERQSFLLRLSDALHELIDPIEVQAAASRVLGEHLQSDRAYYVEIDEARGEYVVARDWHRPGAPSHARRYPLEGWPMPWLIDGQTWVVRDVDVDPAMPDDQRAAYRGNDIGAAIVVPLIKGGQLLATLVTNQRAPRPWTAEEIALVEETAERTWAAVERARAEQALGASEEQFRRAIEEAPIPVIMHAEDGQVLQISRSWTELTGYTLAEVPTLDAWLNHAYGDGADAVRSHVHELFAGNQRSLNVAFDIRTRTGELRHWSFSASSPGTLHDGRRFVVGMALDITEHTRVERALAEQARLLDLSNDAIIVRDVDNRIIYWNRGASELYGWSREEALGQDLHTLLQTEFEAPFEQLIAALREHDRLEGEVVQVTRDGHRITALCRWSLDRDATGRPGAILTTYNDITARKRAETAVRESEARFRSVSDAVPQLIWTNDVAGRATYFNGRWSAYSGLSEEQSAGLGWQVIVHPDDEAAAVERWQQALSRGDVFEAEYRLRRVDGAYRWHLGRNVPLHDTNGRIISWFGSATDIEDLKQAEAALQRAHDELERRVQERTVDLATANRALRQEIAERRQLETQRAVLMERIITEQESERQRIARELHDTLGQFLSALILRLSMAQSREGMDPALRDELAQLRALTGRVDHEVDRLTMELRPPALEHLGLADALASYAEEWTATSGIAVNVLARGLGGSRLPAVAETTSYRIVQEALTNVLKHAHASSVSIIVERRPDELRIIVEDDGVGFEPSQHPRPGHVGRQVGLTGMAERAALAGGKLTIESSPGAGTTIYLHIPLDENLSRGIGDGYA